MPTYVAPTDAQALAEAREPEMWYRDSFIRSMSAEGLEGLHESVYRGAEATIARLSAQTWENLVADALIIGSPETVAAKIAQLEQLGVGRGGVLDELWRHSARSGAPLDAALHPGGHTLFSG